MTRDCWSADRKCIGDLTNRPATRSQQLNDRPTVGIAEGIEGIAGEGSRTHGHNRNKNATFSRPRPE